MTSFAPIFVSHGSPMLALDPAETGRFWESLAAALPRPDAVLCISAHWMTEEPEVSAAPRPGTIHDFYGFPEPLYRLSYPTPGAPEVARRAADLLAAAGIDCAVEPGRGLDHGAWVPLRSLYPAGIPTASFAVQPYHDAAWHCRLGRALAPLCQEGVLVLGSGGATHNLREMAWDGGGTPPWAQRFDDWLASTLEAGDEASFLDWLRKAPDARRAHPSPEHLYPIFVAFGAAGPGARGTRIHQGFTLGSMSMAA
ncbi:MAG TPA: class III extradiol ring-cleavage dioxygenase, partial [Stellaceae bacterium]|nr:class III extradiol ring-cleavage dioxygenase [Stellaceae bacterium]